MKQTTIYDFIPQQAPSPVYTLIASIENELKTNNNKISPNFIDNLLDTSEVTHYHLTGNRRVCVITLPTGHEVLGKAQVLDFTNDIESIGKTVALNNAKNELWSLVGTIAKLFIPIR